MGQNIIKLIKPADIITVANAVLGFTSIIMTLEGQIENALGLILLAVVADGADGAMARYSGYGVLGANLDSLSDVISFGVAPAVVAFVSLSNLGYLAWILSSFFVICGTLRLARFNVSGKKDGFEGIPITAGGFIVVLFILVKDLIPYFEYFFAALLIILSLLMISTIGYPKIKKPIVLAPIAIVILFNVVAFYLGYPDLVKKGSLVLFILIMAYVLSPIWRKLVDRS